MNMTREEATEILDKMPLCNECDSSNFPYTCVECGDAFLMAIEALKQPEIVLCKDCRWWHESETNNGFGDCGQANGITLKPSSWFCADGERR